MWGKRGGKGSSVGRLCVHLYRCGCCVTELRSAEVPSTEWKVMRERVGLETEDGEETRM